NAAQSFLPALVPASELERANSILLPLEMVMSLLAGTALSGVLIGVSIALPFAVNTGIMIVAVIAVAAIPRIDRVRLTKARNWWSELRQSLIFLFYHKDLIGLALFSGAVNFVFFGLMMTVVLIVQERLHFGPLAVSAVMISGAFGGVLAGSVSKRLIACFNRGNILRAATIAVLAFPITVLLTRQGYWGLALICLGFFTNEFWGVTVNTITVSYRQRTIPAELLGRVISIFRLFVKGAAPLGMLTAGFVIHFSEEYVGRDFALMIPYWLSLGLYSMIGFLVWGFLGRIFETR
ncbi:MAG: MFS transporter, partial [Plesiomonas shigelloides]